MQDACGDRRARTLRLAGMVVGAAIVLAMSPMDGLADAPASRPASSLLGKARGSASTAPTTATAPAGLPGVVEQFNFDRNASLILLPVRFDGKEYLFVLDSGASTTIFDISLRAKLGPARQTATFRTGDQPVEMELFDAPNASLGRLSLKQAGLVACTDLALLRRMEGRDIRGILSLAWLARYAIQINYDAGRVTIFRRDGRKHPEWGESVPISVNRQGIPWVALKTGPDTEMECLIDTGMSGTGCLLEEIFDRVIKATGSPTIDSVLLTGSGIQQSRMMRVKALSIQSLRYEGLIFDQGSVCTLGAAFLSRHLVVFDLAGGRMYLKPGKTFSQPDEVDMSGLHIVPVNKTAVVAAVDPGSPAGKAGVRTSDVVLRVNSLEAATLDINQLRGLLQAEDGKQITMLLRRGEQTRQVRFVLKRRI